MATLIVMLGVIAAFAALFAVRLAGAERARWLSRWPAVLFALGAVLALVTRGGIWIAAAFAAAAALSWFFPPSQVRDSSRPSTPDEDAGDAEARAVLGVGADATPAQIRTAFRARMAQAHPDRGGAHADAARLTAARDRLLRR